MYNILFEAAWYALQKTAMSQWGIQTGAVAVLHTWGQNLSLHPHVHMLVPDGGLDEDAMQWMDTGKKFFLPLKVLSKIFRASYFCLLKETFNGKLRIPDSWKHKNIQTEIKKLVYRKDWVVHSEKSGARPGKVIEYLGRYIQKVAISNNRILNVDEEMVRFAYKDYADNGKKKTMTISREEFIRRFMMNIIPQRFCKVRYFGMLSIKNRQAKLKQILSLLNRVQQTPRFQGLNNMEILRLLTGNDFSLCPCCKKGKMILIKPP